jgi:2',3'-cyclic-nucleotide 2'-phosphodiesterase (5'-nucleotidase family)
MVAGHMHTFVKTEVNGIPVIEAGSKGQGVGVIDLDVAQHRVLTHEIRNVFTDSIAPDPIAQRVADAAIAAVAARVNRPVATIAEDMRRQGGDYALGKLVADAWRAAAHADFGAMNRGGVRADLRKGPATYGDLFEVSPFANYLYRVTARGAAMRSYFEKYVSGRPRGWLSGVVLTYDTTRAAGARITSIDLPSGRRFSNDSIYTIGILDFMVTGGDDLGFNGSELKSEPLNIVDLDALITYVASLPQPVVPPTDVRLKVRPWP